MMNLINYDEFDNGIFSRLWLYWSGSRGWGIGGKIIYLNHNSIYRQFPYSPQIIDKIYFSNCGFKS